MKRIVCKQSPDLGPRAHGTAPGGPGARPSVGWRPHYMSIRRLYNHMGNVAARHAHYAIQLAFKCYIMFRVFVAAVASIIGTPICALRFTYQGEWGVLSVKRIVFIRACTGGERKVRSPRSGREVRKFRGWIVDFDVCHVTIDVNILFYCFFEHFS